VEATIDGKVVRGRINRRTPGVAHATCQWQLFSLRMTPLSHHWAHTGIPRSAGLHLRTTTQQSDADAAAVDPGVNVHTSGRDEKFR